MAWGWRPWLPGWHHGLWGALEAERPDACSFLLWWEHHHYGQGYRNWVWYWCVVLGVLSPGRQSWPPPITQAWIGLQYPQQLKESSPQAGDLQVTEPHLEMGTLVFAPP